MTRGSEARAALKAECEAAIEDIRRNGHQSGCKAHEIACPRAASRCSDARSPGWSQRIGIHGITRSERGGFSARLPGPQPPHCTKPSRER